MKNKLINIAKRVDHKTAAVVFRTIAKIDPTNSTQWDKARDKSTEALRNYIVNEILPQHMLKLKPSEKEKAIANISKLLNDEKTVERWSKNGESATNAELHDWIEKTI